MLKTKSTYDYLLVGAGLFNAIFAYEAIKNRRKCLVVEKRAHLGGNLYCKSVAGINIHQYGPHIFHTNNIEIWKYISKLTELNNFINSPLAKYKDKLYNLPFNMNTFHQLWNIVSPKEAKMIIEGQRQHVNCPKNLEEQALSLCGNDIYEKLIKGYTEKQWGKNANQLPAFIIKRIPIRYTYNNNYFNSVYQGIPIGGYNELIERCFNGCDFLFNCDFTKNREIRKQASTIIYTGMIDEYYEYCFGELEYRSLKFEHELLDMENYQGNAVVNYTERSVPYTRIIEHKHFEFGTQPKTVITKEYPHKMQRGLEPFYPVNTEQNNKIFEKYNQLGKTEKNIFFGGRLGAYQYINMDETVENALSLFRTIN